MVGVGPVAAGAGITAGALWYTTHKPSGTHQPCAEDLVQEGFKPQSAYYPTAKPAAPAVAPPNAGTDAQAIAAIEGTPIQRTGSFKQWWQEKKAARPNEWDRPLF